jgi:hypothetical protein
MHYFSSASENNTYEEPEETNRTHETRHEAMRRMELWKKSKLTQLQTASDELESDEMTDRYHLKMQECFNDAMNNARDLIRKSNAVTANCNTTSKFKLSDFY